MDLISLFLRKTHTHTQSRTNRSGNERESKARKKNLRDRETGKRGAKEKQ